MFTDLNDEQFQAYIEAMEWIDLMDWYARNKDELSDQELYLIGQEMKRRETSGSDITREEYESVQATNVKSALS